MSRRIRQFVSTFMISTLATFINAACAGAEVVRDDDCDLARSCGISAYQWREENSTPKAIVVIVHGFTHQGLSPEELARQIAKDGYLVFSIDQRGHGRWTADVHNRHGVHAYKPSEQLDYKASIDDLRHFIECVKLQYPQNRIYCVGESSGAAVIAEAARRPDSGIDGMVLASAGTRPRLFNFVWVTTDFLSNIFRLDHPISIRKYVSLYASNEPRIIDEMFGDPLDRKDMTGRELLRTVAFISHTTSNLKHVANATPLLLLQGKQDHLLQQTSVQMMFGGARSTDKNIVLFPEYGHVLLGTKFIHPDVVDTIRTWLDTRSSKGVLSAAVRPILPTK